MNSDKKTPEQTLRPVGALFCLFLSLMGAGIGAYLTVLKFRMSYTPCLSDANSCRVGEMTCTDALSSSWSMLLNLPISLWGTAFYLMTGMLSVAVLRRREDDVVSDLLLLCAVWSVLMTLILGGYTLLALESACPFCLSLYTISVLFLTGAVLARGPQSLRRIRTWTRSMRASPTRLSELSFYAALALIVAAGAQSMTYHGSRRFVSLQDGCPEPVDPLPVNTIKAGADEPKAILVMFIDLTCTVCLEEFKKLGKALQAGKFTAPVQLWVFHTPRQTCDPAAFPAGAAKSDDYARNNNACLAARAAECMEKLRPGSGFDYLGNLFALHLARVEDTPLFTAERVGNMAVELDLPIDPDEADNILFDCIDHDTEILARITEHQKFAEKNNFKVPTLAVYRAKDGAPDLTGKPYWIPANSPLEGALEVVAAKAHEVE